MTNEKSIAQVVEEGERLLAIQSPGEWTAFEDSVYQGSIPIAHCTVLFRNEEQPCATAALIVHLHNHFPALLAAAKEAEGLRVGVNEVREAFKRANAGEPEDIIAALTEDDEMSLHSAAGCIDGQVSYIAHLRQSLTDAEKERDEARRVAADLAMIVRELLRKPPSEERRAKFHDYLKRNGLEGSILRESSPSSAAGEEVKG